MSYEQNPNQPPGGRPWGQPAGDPGPGTQPPYGSPPPGYQAYTNQPYGNQLAGPRLAGWWYRVGATIIDGLIIVIPSAIIGAATNRLVYYVVAVLGGVIYATMLIGGSGRTVGMMALGTRCLDTATGTPIGYGRGALRWLVAQALWLPIIGGIVDILWPLWDDKNQTLHDKVASSVVVLTRS